MARQTTATIDADLEPVLRRMEETGVKLNIGYLETLASDLRDQLANLEEQIFEAVGHPFAINSPKQLSAILFSELNLGLADGVQLRKKATGFSTAAHELEKLRSLHPVIDLILRYREVGKLLSTYVEPLPQLADSSGRLHTHYAPDAASGRLSSRKPNLQNIPNRTELGRKIRQAFVAEEGYTLLIADYSQIQLRIIAHLAQDQVMIDVFTSGGDIHTKTSEGLGVDRRTAKAVNFGIIYGLTSYGLAESLGVDRQDAQNFIDGFLTTYPGVARYMQELIDEAEKQGYTETMFGKRRPLPEIQSQNDYIRKAAERVALNHPIQGAEADIMKLAMIKLAGLLQDPTKIRMILQVHDELVFEVVDGQLEAAIQLIVPVMTEVVPLSVPLTVDLKTGNNWSEVEKFASTG